MSNHLIQEELDYNIHYLEEEAKKILSIVKKGTKNAFHSMLTVL